MFNVTNAAVARLAEELGRLERPAQKVVRFCRGEDRMHLRLSDAQPDDQGFTHDGKVVLVVDPTLARQLTRRTLDIKQTPKGTKLCLA
jgi:hypothetical protein